VFFHRHFRMAGRIRRIVVLSIFQTTFPFFALVLCGYIAAKRGMLPLAAIPGLNSFVLYFALPCMLFRFGASTPVTQLLDVSLFGTYLVCAMIMVAFTMAMTLGSRINWNDAAFGSLVAAFPNTGFMGVPLLVALLGTRAAGPTIVTICVDMIITSSLCIALSRLGGSDAHGASKAVKNALKGIAVNPMPWSILLGGIASAFALQLPGPVAKTVGLLAESASPVALFTIGAVLARPPTGGVGSTQLADYVPVAIIKLLLHPLLVLLVGLGAIQIGVPIDSFALTVMVLVASLPSASNVVLLSERFGANSERIARIILVSTALSFLTFSGAVAIMV